MLPEFTPSGQGMGVHKQVRLHPKQYRFGIFQFMGLFYWWVVCPFGAVVSSLWWQRLGSLLGRCVSALLDSDHSRLLYVDDFVWRFLDSVGMELAARTIFLMLLFDVPLHFGKLKYGRTLEWVGYLMCFSQKLVSLPTSAYRAVNARRSTAAHTRTTSPS